MNRTEKIAMRVGCGEEWMRSTSTSDGRVTNFFCGDINTDLCPECQDLRWLLDRLDAAEQALRHIETLADQGAASTDILVSARSALAEWEQA